MKTKTINLRNLPEDLVRQAKVLAAWRGISLKDFVVQAIQQAVTAQQASTSAFFVAGKERKKRKHG